MVCSSNQPTAQCRNTKMEPRLRDCCREVIISINAFSKSHRLRALVDILLGLPDQIRVLLVRIAMQHLLDIFREVRLDSKSLLLAARHKVKRRVRRMDGLSDLRDVRLSESFELFGSFGRLVGLPWRVADSLGRRRWCSGLAAGSGGLCGVR